MVELTEIEVLIGKVADLEARVVRLEAKDAVISPLVKAFRDVRAGESALLAVAGNMGDRVVFADPLIGAGIGALHHTLAAIEQAEAKGRLDGDELRSLQEIGS